MTGAADNTAAPSVITAEITVFVNPKLEELKRLVIAARARLADLEAAYTQQRHAADVTQALLFQLLSPPPDGVFHFIHTDSANLKTLDKSSIPCKFPWRL